MEESVNTSYNQNSGQQNNSAPSPASSQKINPIYLTIFLAIVFLALVLVLNYFNILSISTLFPNQFGWLPHKEQAKPPQTQITVTPTGYIRFPYDTQKAEKILKDYVSDSLKDTFVPSRIEVKQSLLTTGELKGVDYQFGANWTLGKDTFNAALHYIKNTNDLRDSEIFITLRNAQDAPIDSTNSAAIIKNYLKNIPETVIFDCGSVKETTKFCEYFIIKDEGKSGFGTVKTKDKSGTETLFLYSCFFPKNDSYYTKRTSCLLFRESDPRGL